MIDADGRVSSRRWVAFGHGSSACTTCVAPDQRRRSPCGRAVTRTTSSSSRSPTISKRWRSDSRNFALITPVRVLVDRISCARPNRASRQLNPFRLRELWVPRFRRGAYDKISVAVDRTVAYWTKCHDGTVMSVKKSSELRATTIRLVHVAESLYVEKIRMQVEREIIERWLEDKLGGSRRRLRAPGAAEFTYQGPQWGHPSNFAAVKMRCEPSDALTFRSVAVAPPAISEAYFEKILAAIR